MVTGSPTRRLRRLGGLFLLALLLSWTLVAYGQLGPAEPGPLLPGREAGLGPAGGPEGPPELEIPESSLRSGLLEGDVAVVQQYVTYWVDKFTEAATEEAILDARVRLVRGYNRYENWQFQSVYAEQAVKVLAPLLESPDIRKQINAAMAVSQMREVAVQPLLESLVVSRNPALRLYGWTGYRRIRLLVLAQGKEPVGRMLAALEKASMTEDSGPVMGAILEMMYLAPDRPSIVSASVFDETRTRLLAIFRQCWPRVCQKVLDGHRGMIRAAGAGLDALRQVASDEDATKETQLAAVQMVVDLVWCAAKCYATGGQTAAQMAANEALLRECETALNAITKLRKIPINKALGTKSEQDRAAEVEVAVSTWTRFLENANWPVREPKFQPSAGLSTRPAGGASGE